MLDLETPQTLWSIVTDHDHYSHKAKLAARYHDHTN